MKCQTKVKQYEVEQPRKIKPARWERGGQPLTPQYFALVPMVCPSPRPEHVEVSMRVDEENHSRIDC